MVSGLPRLGAARERMEAPDADRAQLEPMLRDLAWVNRWLGGTALVLRHLTRLAPRGAEPLRILDAGTGYADIPRAIATWARRAGRRVAITAVDRHPAIVALAAQASADTPEVRVVAADALRLPFGTEAFHVVVASLVLHHMEGEAPVALLRELDRVASLGVIVNDLRRGWLPLAGTAAAVRLLSRDPMIRHDGPLSVRRAFTPPEALGLARQAGWDAPTVWPQRWFRMALVADKRGHSRAVRA